MPDVRARKSINASIVKFKASSKKAVSVTKSDGSSYGFTVLGYSKLILESNWSQDDRNLAAAAYLYSRVANAFFI